MAISATLHCLTGCAIGEVLGMVLATWWGWGDLASLLVSLAIAFVVTVPVNHWMIGRGRGHAAVHHLHADHDHADHSHR
jgi:multisubunit Na+/H+ antiporter MnhG subunit